MLQQPVDINKAFLLDWLLLNVANLDQRSICPVHQFLPQSHLLVRTSFHDNRLNNHRLRIELFSTPHLHRTPNSILHGCVVLVVWQGR